MKTIFITIITLFLSFNATTIQDEITVDVIYDGYYDGLYSFTTITDDEDDFGDTIEFGNISAELLKKFDLKSDIFNGEIFIITYSETTIEENEEELTVYRLLNILKLNND
jgi:hypothetical protein